MHLIPKSKLYGQPARSVRDFLRRVGLDKFDEGDLQSCLGISKEEASTVVAGLLADEYIDTALPYKGVPQFGLRGKGAQLAMATFAPQITRAAGEQLLADVLARAGDTASQDQFVFRITKIALFGSMLGDAELISDLDIALAVKPRVEGKEFDERNQRRIDIAKQGGKRFRNMLEEVAWPRIEQIDFLKAGSKYVSIHSFTELELLHCPYKLVFESHGDDPGT